MSTDSTETRSVAELEQFGPDEVVRELEGRAATEILEWAVRFFGEEEIAATSSFQTQSIPLLHRIAQLDADLPVVFLDTGFHFPETLSFRDRVAEEFGLEVQSVTNRLGHDEFRRKYGALHRRDPDMCCHLNKVEPLGRALEPKAAWISGVRRDQTPARRETPVVAQSDKGGGTYKICPMVEWTAEDVDAYIEEHDLPTHPLTAEGYTSIGCSPCTACPSSEESGERSGRWPDREKTECGLHLESEGEQAEVVISEDDETSE